ncbi:HTH_Tnp_Tc3_2 domain-containing protein [Trichonephila clavipes]|nr:HTH_Tnp_Tc3_2 domain-containing protein [Trichonephila clavipes]
MEIGLSQADAARRLNLSRSVVQRLWDQCQSEDSVQKTCSRPTTSYNTCRRPFFLALSARRRRTYCAAARCRPLSSIRKKNLRYYGRNRLHNAVLYARRPVVCVPLNGRQRRNRLCWAREHVSWTQQWAYVLFTAIYNESDSGRLLIWSGNSALDTINPTLLKDTVIEVVESWFEQGSRSVVTLTCICSMEEP